MAMTVDTRDTGRMRVRLDGTWDARAMADYFDAIDGLYEFHSLLDLIGLDPLSINSSLLGAFSDFWFGDRRFAYYGRWFGWFELEVTAVQFGSPGFSDFLGVAATIKEVRESIQAWVQRDHDAAMRREEHVAKRLENFN